MSKSLDRLQPWGALAMRLALGAAMIYHGYQKLVPPGGFHHGNALAGMDHFSRFIVTLGMPYWLGYVSVLTEFFGGILLLLGLLTRLTAGMIAINMTVALISVNRHQGYSGSEYTLALIALALMLIFYGGGALALDRRRG